MINISKPTIGLLPLYSLLYDETVPSARKRIDQFHKVIISELAARGLDVKAAPVCRIKPEFAAAIKSFEAAKVDAIVTIHLAYSPSLESSDVLASTKLPIIILDTTESYDFGPLNGPDEIMYNHGIHGVQDMCNLLIRNGKHFELEAGHWKESDVIDRVTAWVRAAFLCNQIKISRVGRLGSPFEGMGDFFVESEVLEATTGIKTIPCEFSKIKEIISKIEDEEINQELEADIKKFTFDGISKEDYFDTVRVCLGVRKWIKQENLSAFTMNFLDFNKANGFEVVPFLEASKCMARGVGYAGESDVITAALVATLATLYQDVSFIEMFCPDWKNDSIFLSHMGELNINLVDGKPALVKTPFPYTDAKDPVIAIGRFREGKSTMVCLAPGYDNSYTLIIAPITVLSVDGRDEMNQKVRGWFKPEVPISQFLAQYSRVGGTHHLALVYQDVAADIEKFGVMLGCKVVVIK